VPRRHGSRAAGRDGLPNAKHRIRLDISSSNFPHFDVNPNSGEPPALARAPRIAVNRVHFGAGQASHVVLPLVSTASLESMRPSHPAS
jgi:hypothetical protein